MTSETKTAIPDLETATQRATETGERLADAGRKITTAYLDGLEKYIAGFAAFERKIAAQTQVEGIASLLDTHAKVTEDVVKASVSTARELVAA